MFYDIQKIRNFLHNIDWRDEPAVLIAEVKFNFNDGTEDEQSLEDVQDCLLMINGDENVSSYLNDINLPNLAKYHQKFLMLLRDLEFNTPWVITGVSGLDQLSKRDSKNGSRLGKEGAEITLKTMNGLGQRAKEIKDLYKSFAFDGKYMRWNLPINKRLFSMTISVYNLSQFDDPKVLRQTNAYEVQDKTGMDVLPVHTFICKHCEFKVFDNGPAWMSDIDNKEGTELEEDAFKIVVGDVENASIYDEDFVINTDKNDTRERASVDKNANIDNSGVRWQQGKGNIKLNSPEISSSRISSKYQLDTFVDTWTTAATNVISATKQNFTNEEGKFSLDKLKGAAKNLVIDKLQAGLQSLNYIDEFRNIDEKMKYLSVLTQGATNMDFGRDLKILKDLFGNSDKRLEAAAEQILEELKQDKNKELDVESLEEELKKLKSGFYGEKDYIGWMNLKDKYKRELQSLVEELVTKGILVKDQANAILAGWDLYNEIKEQDKVEEHPLEDKTFKERFKLQTLQDEDLSDNVEQPALIDQELKEKIEEPQLEDKELDEKYKQKELQDEDMTEDIDEGQLQDQDMTEQIDEPQLQDQDLTEQIDEGQLQDVSLKDEQNQAELVDQKLEDKEKLAELKDIELADDETVEEIQDIKFDVEKKETNLRDVFFNSTEQQKELQDVKLEGSYVQQELQNVNLDEIYKQAELNDVKLSEEQVEAVLKDEKFIEEVKEEVLRDIEMNEELKDADLTNIVLESKYEQGKLVDFNLVDTTKKETKLRDLKLEEETQMELKADDIEELEPDDLAEEFAPDDADMFAGKQVASGEKETLMSPAGAISKPREIRKQNHGRERES